MSEHTTHHQLSSVRESSIPQDRSTERNHKNEEQHSGENKRKRMHGQLPRNLDEKLVDIEQSYCWLKSGDIKGETESRVQLKCDGTRWRTGGEVKGKLVNGVGSQYPSLPRNVVYPTLLPLMRTPRLPAVDWTDAPADLNGLVRFAERQNLVSAHVPSHFKRSLQ